MNREEILNFIEQMSHSQGFYGRLLGEVTEEGLDYLGKMNFKHPLDLVLFLECGA